MVFANYLFKNLALLIFLIVARAVFAGDFSFQQENFKTHKRWNFFINKSEVEIKHSGINLILGPQNQVIYNDMVLELTKIKDKNSYIKDISFINDDSLIKVTLASPAVEVFSFYKDSLNKYVIDFWINDDISRGISEQDPSKTLGKIKDTVVIKKQNNKKIIKPKINIQLKASSKPVIKDNHKKVVKKKIGFSKNSNFRDFRYGAPFIWDYEAMLPQFNYTVNLKSKTPEYFYPVKDVNYEESDQKAHLQLAINLFKKKKWGLMYKSLKLYEKKYLDQNIDFIQYLKGNAILRNSFKKEDKKAVKMAVNIMENISERTNNYDLKRGISKYLINYYVKNKEYVKALKKSKILYVVSKENFDIEESSESAESILYCLAKLSQLNIIQEFVKEKTIKKLVPKQTLIAYEYFTLLKIKDNKMVINKFEKIKKSLKQPIHRTILYNVAESYFREGKFQKSYKLFDKFVYENSFHSYSERARLRIALSYEFLDKEPLKTIELYKNAIDRSQSYNINYEASLRYVAFRILRNKKPSKEDWEVSSFMEIDEYKKKTISRNHLKLLWIVRLRSFIVQEKWDKALAYLNVIPLNSMLPSEKRVFQADGAEIIYGIISDFYKNSHYSKVVRAWSMYKDQYFAKVAADPFMNYIVGQSYIKLGLYQGFDKAYAIFEKIKDAPIKTFPNWTRKIKFNNTSRMLVELQLIKNIHIKNWSKMSLLINQLENEDSSYNKINYFKGILAYKQKKYKETEKHLETYFALDNGLNIQDVNELADVIMAYADSVYKSGKLDKFVKVSAAILNDTKSVSSNKFMKHVRERISYLELETLSGDKNSKTSLLVESKILKFLKTYPKSDYFGRVEYLLSMAYMENKKQKEGKDLLNKILADDRVSKYIKELAKTELSLIKIREKVL